MKEGTGKIFKNVLRAVCAAAIFLTVLLKYDSLVNLDVRAVVEKADNLFAVAAIILCVYALKSVTFVIPAMVIYMSVGMSFDIKTALLVNAAGIALEVIITYFLGVFLSGEKVVALLEKNKGGRKLLSLYEGKRKISFLLTVRLLPVFPIDFTSLFLGASGFSFPAYFIISMLGIMPRVAAFTVLGDGVYKFFPKELLLKLILIIIPAAAASYVIFLIVKKKKKKKDGENISAEIPKT